LPEQSFSEPGGRSGESILRPKETDMYDANLPPGPPPQPMQPYPPPQPGKSWPPFMGMLSILTVVFPFLFFCIYCLIIYYVFSQPGFNAERMTDTDLMNFGLGTIALICGIFIVSIVGIVIGLGALFGRTANKVLGLVGLLLNAFVLLSIICGFLLLMLA
jgi:magnesium-transporting ATPase (P-type)